MSRTFGDVVRDLLSSIRKVETRYLPSAEATAITLVSVLPYRCEPTLWGIEEEADENRVKRREHASSCRCARAPDRG